MSTVETKLLPEPMASEDVNRLALFPIKHLDLYQNREDQKKRFWTENEIDLSRDAADWDTMTTAEQEYVALTLAFFANSDNAVMENIANRFRTEIRWPEAQLALAFQAMMESIHVVSYNNMIDTVIRDPQEKVKLFNAAETHPIVSVKIGVIQKYASDPETPLHVCLAAQAFAEGVGFCASFCTMMWLRKKQICPGICFGNEKIMVDESLHVKLFALLYRKAANKLSEADLVAMCEDFVSIEDAFVDQLLPYNVKGMNKTLMKQYVRCTADMVLRELGAGPHYKVANPFPWMEKADMLSKSNFFEKPVAEYQLVQDESAIRTQEFTNLGDDLDF